MGVTDMKMNDETNLSPGRGRGGGGRVCRTVAYPDGAAIAGGTVEDSNVRVKDTVVIRLDNIWVVDCAADCSFQQGTAAAAASRGGLNVLIAVIHSRKVHQVIIPLHNLCIPCQHHQGRHACSDLKQSSVLQLLSRTDLHANVDGRI